MDVGEGGGQGKVLLRKVAESGKKYNGLSVPELMKNIAELEKKMFQLAKDLEFEQAASMRDEVEMLRQKLVDIS